LFFTAYLNKRNYSGFVAIKLYAINPIYDAATMMFSFLKSQN